MTQAESSHEPVSHPLVSVVLPCLNEEASVASVVRESADALLAAGLAGEVVVADNGSTDESAARARAAGARVVDAPVPGYGSALAAGFDAARGDICVMGDADATYPFERLVALVDPILRDEADMTVGSRWVGLTTAEMPILHRYVGTPVISWLVRRAGGPNISDSQSGFRAFRRERVLSLGLRATGMEYASEMLILAGRADWRVMEIPTGYRARIGESKLNTFRDGWRHLRIILLLAPDLAATVPGAILAGLGTVALGWALVDPSLAHPGAPGWVASFVGLAAFVLGCQAVLAGLLLASTSWLAPRTVAIPVRRLLPTYRTLGLWALGSGTVLAGALVVAWTAGLPTPSRAAEVALLSLALVVVGVTAWGGAIIAGLFLEGAQQYGMKRSRDPAPASGSWSAREGSLDKRAVHQRLDRSSTSGPSV